MSRFNLPVFTPAATPATPTELVRQSMYAQEIYETTLGEKVRLDAGVAIVSPEFPTAGNGLLDAQLAAEADPKNAIAEVDALFAQHGLQCRKWLVGPENRCAGLADALASQGYSNRPLTLWSLQSAAALPIRNDLMVIPSRAAFGALQTLEDGLWSECSNLSLVHERREAAVRRLDDPRIDSLLALHDGVPVGAVDLVGAAELGQIAALGVHPDYQRTGVAMTLLMLAFDLAQRSRYKHLTVFTETSYAPAGALYRKAGFAAIASADLFSRP